MINAIWSPPMYVSLCGGISVFQGQNVGIRERGIVMRNRHEVMGTRQKWMWIVMILGVLLVTSAVPGYARVRVFVRPSVVVPFGPYYAHYGGPYWAPYDYPAVVVTPPPTVYVQPAPQAPAQPPSTPSSWYYCENPQGYYPYVQQCPGGWRPVAPTPQ